MDTALHRIDVGELLHDSSGSTSGSIAVVVPRIEVFGICEHEGRVRDLVLGLKYASDKHAAVHLAEIVATAVRSEIVTRDIARVTWAPTTDARRNAREFDHAEMIARHVGAMCGLRTHRLLRRTNTGSQTDSSRAERLSRPEFVARPGVRGHVMVIDDVVTTGATFVAAARALVIAGASAVTCIAPSWTPHQRRVSRSRPPR